MNIDFELVDFLKNKIIGIYEQSKEIFDLNIENKEGNDIVTDVDLFMEKEIIKVIKEIFPEHSIHGEEFGESISKSEYEWLLDPIDGTINYANGIPLFSTSIALNKNDETILGLILVYSENNYYYAIKGQGAYCNGEKLEVSQKSELQDSVISFCLTSHYDDSKIDEVLDVEKMLANKVRGLRLIVSSAIELAWCASGIIEGCINIKPSKGIGSAAGKLLVTEAGGTVTNIKGNKRQKIDTMLVTNGKIHQKLVNALKYVVFFGNITEVIEINPSKDIKVYMAGKAYSQALFAAQKGVNAKLITAISGLRKKEKDELLKNIKEQNIDISHIKISNDIDNDLKIIITGEDGEKSRVEDIYKGSSEAVDEELIEDNIEVIKNASYIVCQTKIKSSVTNKMIKIAKENNIPVVLSISRANSASNENVDLQMIEDSTYVICAEKEFEQVFENQKLDNVLAQYPNKLIILMENDGIKYHNGESIQTISYTDNTKIFKVGVIDIFIGYFVAQLANGSNLKESIEGALSKL